MEYGYSLVPYLIPEHHDAPGCADGTPKAWNVSTNFRLARCFDKIHLLLKCEQGQARDDDVHVSEDSGNCLDWPI